MLMRIYAFKYDERGAWIETHVELVKRAVVAYTLELIFIATSLAALFALRLP